MKEVFNSACLFIVSFVILSSCRAVNTSMVDFPQTVRLSCIERTIKDIYLKYPFRVRLAEHYLYITDIHPTAYYCHQFKYPSMQYTQSFIKRGEGPEEFLDAENIRTDHQGHLWILDANKEKLVRFNQDNLAHPSATINLDPRLIRTLDFDVLNDSLFIVPDYTGSHRLSIINRQGKLVRQLFQIPSLDNSSKNGVVMAQAWRSFLSYHAGHGVIAMVTQLGQVLEVYNILQNKVIYIAHNTDAEPKFTVNGNYAVPRGIMGYSDVYVGENGIYALFWGQSFDDIKQNPDIKEGGRFIHVFDLSGKPIKKYVLDRYITGFCIDESNRKILALDVNAEQPLIEYSY